MDQLERNRRLTGATAIVMVATFISRVTGFLRTLLIYTKMRPGGYSDEFLMAFTLPDIVYDLLAGGAIAAALIPVFSAYITKGKEHIGWRAVSTFMNLTIILMVVLEIIFFIWTDELLSVLAAGYNEGSSGDKALLVSLTRILLLSAPFMMLAGQCNGILNSYKRFTVAAFGPVVYNICTIISIAIFGSVSPQLTAWGVVISAALFFGIQMMATVRHFSLYQPRLFLNSKAFRKLLHLAIPSLLSSLILELNLIISKGYATFFDKGMLTLLNNANRTWQLPLGIFAQSIGIAMLPTLSEHYATNNGSEYGKVLNKGIRVVFLLSLPTALFMMVLSQDIMRVLFKWGSLSESDVIFGGACLLAYAAALIFASMTALLNRAFYSIQDSKTPLIGGIIGIAANFAFNWFFRNYTTIDVAGTALSYSLASVVNTGILVFAFYRKTGIHIIYDNGRYVLRSLFAAVPSGLAVFLLSLLIRPDIGSKLSQIVCLALPLAAGLFIFWYLCMKIRIPEIDTVNKLVLSGLNRVKSMVARNKNG
ncbi:MAG: murein biosynthesis integral membrane protein MurJ [Clostridiaceae bacterium]|jgi:putative peptidoglycan lipid II flippase|nr:murein biosynthesis integral membrane protein MurJ [Clostridiaceae bacterium]